MGKWYKAKVRYIIKISNLIMKIVLYIKKERKNKSSSLVNYNAITQNLNQTITHKEDNYFPGFIKDERTKYSTGRPELIIIQQIKPKLEADNSEKRIYNRTKKHRISYKK